MEAGSLLQEVALVAVVGVLVSVVLGRLRLPTVTGLLLSGALIGPHSLALLSDPHSIEVIAEMGVVLLLFTIGLEFSLDRLRHIFRHVALGGLLQVLGTIAAVLPIAVLLGRSFGAAIFYGFVFALSSTAIVLKTLSVRQELDAPHGRFIVGTLIFQDLCVIPMVLLVPLLKGSEPGTAFAALAIALGKATLVVVGVLMLSRILAPRILRWVEASRSRELFILSVLSLCIGTAWLTSLLGLSLALGAFLGGMVVAGTEFSHRAMGDVLPLRDVFLSFFFVSLGMFFDARVLVEQPDVVVLLLAGFVLAKGALATGAAMLMRFPPRAAWLAGVGLAQFGEFSFVLIQLGTSVGIVGAPEVAPLLCAGIISMVLTPLLVHRAPHVTAGERILAPLAKLLRARVLDESRDAHLENHVIIIGYGVAGRMVSESLGRSQVPHLVLELNAENVRQGRHRKHPVYYADATSEEALGHAHVGSARAVVVLINDPEGNKRVIDTVRRVAPHVPIFLRTRYLGETSRLRALGATDVVAEEVEGAVEMLARVLRELEVPRNLIDDEIDLARQSTQHSARAVVVPRSTLGRQVHLADLKVESVAIPPGSGAAGRSLRELDLRHRTGTTVVAVRRDGTLLTPPPADDPIQAGDVVYLIGDRQAVRSAIDVLVQPQ